MRYAAALILLLAAPAGAETRHIDIPECSSSFVLEYELTGWGGIPATNPPGEYHADADMTAWRVANGRRERLNETPASVQIIPGGSCFDADPRQHLAAALPPGDPCLDCEGCGEWRGEPRCTLIDDERCPDGREKGAEVGTVSDAEVDVWYVPDPSLEPGMCPAWDEETAGYVSVPCPPSNADLAATLKALRRQVANLEQLLRDLAYPDPCDGDVNCAVFTGPANPVVDSIVDRMTAYNSEGDP